jgi:hypothetical protein
MHRGGSKLINLLEIFDEHVRVLVILCRNVLLNGLGEGDVMGAPEGQREEVAVQMSEGHILGREHETRTRTWRGRWGGRRDTQVGCLFTRRANFQRRGLFWWRAKSDARIVTSHSPLATRGANPEAEGEGQ